MSRLHPNKYPNWAPDRITNDLPSSQDGRVTMDTNLNSQNSTNLPSESDNAAAGSDSTWDIQRIMELDRNKNWREAWNPRMSMSFTNTKGLLNAPGDNNCFLNSAVQVLWHLDVFRRSFRMLSGHSCLGNHSCIFCALKVIFTQFQYSDQSALPPDALRKALAKTFADQHRFQLGLMDDAAECFENILTQIHFHIANGESEDMCNARHCIPHQMFAMTIVEQIVCQCEATSEPLPFSQMVHYVSTSALVNQVKTAYAQNSAASFGQLLKQTLSDVDHRTCPSACGKRVQLRRTLMNCPDVVSVGLVWDSDNPSPEHIHEVVRSIGTTIRLRELFHSVVDPKCRQGSQLHLAGIVCYYGKHYSTFFFHSKMKTWVSFDDANVREMGSQWSAVVDKCCRGHYQPLLLLYANPDAEPICTTTAPQKTVIVKENRFLNNNDEGGGSTSGSYHCRQRSCDSLSGTVGGQCADDFIPVTTTTHGKGRRSMTPDPHSVTHVSKAVPRRSITPGPEWGKYDSTEDVRQPKPDPGHVRQSSYLLALDTADGKNSANPHPQNTAPPGEHAHRLAEDYARPGDNIGAYSVRYAQLGQNHSGSVDLLGSLPGHTKDSNSNRGQQSYHGDTHSNRYGYQQNQGSGYPRSSAYPAVTTQEPITSVARSYNNSQVTNSHGGVGHQYTTAPPGGMGHQYSTAPHHGAYSNSGHPAHTPISHTGQNPHVGHHYTAPNPNSGPNHHHTGPNNHHTGPNNHHTGSQPCHQPQSAPTTPVIKRTRSLETTDSVVIHNGQPRPSVTRHRPSSARPYDYGNTRPTVDPQTGAIVMPTKAQEGGNHRNTSAVPQGWEEDVLIGDFTTADSCEPTPSNKQTAAKHSWDNTEEDNYGTYINRKTVQNVLNIQKNRNSKPTGPAGSVGGIKTASMHGSTSSLEAAEQKQQKAWLHNQALMRDLKVDIPGDNISLGSHKDSGYRSGGSSGDRNSASSASSTSFDSPTADSLRGFSATHRPLGHTNNCSSHSSSESLSSNQSGQTVKTIQGNRLSQIPENNLPSSSNSSSTQTVNKSQESLVGSQDGIDGYQSDRYSDNQLENDPAHSRIPNPIRDSSRNNTKTSHNPASHTQDVECERLFLQAESLMESSNKQEEISDIHSALAYCDQAITCLQKALSLQGTSNDTAVRVRMKHNSCVLRSRRLHKSILERQQSNQSSSSSQSTGSCHSMTGSDGSLNSRNSDDSNRFSSSSSNSQSRTRRRSDRHQMDLERPKHDPVPDVYKQQHSYPSSHHSNSNNVNGSSANPGYQPHPNNHHGNNSQPGYQSGHHSNVGHHRSQPQPGVKQLASGVAQSRPVQGVSVGTCNIPKSVTDGSLSEHAVPRRMVSVDGAAVSRSRNNSMSNDLDQSCLDADDARYVEIYGTLPKRKGKGSKSPVPVPDPHVPKQPVEVYQSYLQRQKTAAVSMEGGYKNASQGSDPGPRGSVINHTRQWSKDDIRDILLKDFVNRSGSGGTKSQTEPQTAANQYQSQAVPHSQTVHPAVPQTAHPAVPRSQNQMMPPAQGQVQTRTRRRNSYDLLDSRVKNPGNVSHSRQNSYEDLLAKETGQIAIQDLPPKQRPAQMPVPVPTLSQAPTESHYDYLPGRNPHRSSLGSSILPPYPSSSKPVVNHVHLINNHGNNHGNQHSNINNHSNNHSNKYAEINRTSHTQTSEAHQSNMNNMSQHTGEDTSRNVKPSAVQSLDKANHQKPYVKSIEIQRPDEQGKPAVVETVPIKIKPDLPPKLKAKPSKPSKPSKAAKPDVPKRRNSQLSTFKGDDAEINAVLSNTVLPSNGMGTHDRGDRLTAGYDLSDCDFPPPPDELLYPAATHNAPLSGQGLPEPQATNQQPVGRCTCGVGNQGSMDTLPPPSYPANPARDHGQKLSADASRHAVPTAETMPPPPPPPTSSPAKPSLAKKKKPVPIGRKSVSFSDNIALIATPEEVSQEIDYVAYVMNLGKNKNGSDETEPKATTDSDDNTVDSMDGEEMLKENFVLCTLCRKKRIEPTELYCQGCCFYMSQFQPQDS